MTDERKNEIWAMLTPDERKKIKAGYKAEIGARLYNDGYNSALENIFGKHNLTAQAKEKPKEPKYKVGDMVRVVNRHYGSSSNMYLGMTGEVVEIESNHLIINNGIKNVNLPSYMVEPYALKVVKQAKKTDQNCENLTENGISDSKIQSKSAESVETSANSQTISRAVKNVDYAAYRLDLAKEIAVAMMPVYHKERAFIEMGQIAVEMSNAIVKRLKETEE